MEKRKEAVEFDRRVDVWNTGILFYMLLYKSLMFKQAKNSRKFLKNEWKIKTGEKDPQITI